MKRLAPAAIVILIFALYPTCASASVQVVGYWRMEIDNNPDAQGLSTPNELAGLSALIAPHAVIDTDVPVNPVPNTGAGNFGSIDPIDPLGGGAGINGTIAEYAGLNVDSITVEFWARTLEGQGSLVERKSGNTGFEIFMFNDVRVRYFVDDGFGGGEEVLLTGAGINMDENWVNIAWTYDAASGVGRLYADGELRAEHDGADGRALVWGSQDILVGTIMDGNGGTQGVVEGGLIDELRISDGALSRSGLLATIPEPTTLVIWSLLATLGLSVGWRQRRRTA